jgi:hypothetical protein
MIIGGFAAGVRILLKKDLQDTIFWNIRKIYYILKAQYEDLK